MTQNRKLSHEDIDIPSDTLQDMLEYSYDIEGDSEIEDDSTFTMPTQEMLDESNKLLIENINEKNNNLDVFTPQLNNQNLGLDTIGNYYNPIYVKNYFENLEIDSDLKVTLNQILHKIKFHTRDEWNEKAEKIGAYGKIEDGISSARQIYLTAGVKTLKQSAIDNNWNFGISNNKKYIYTGKHWSLLSLEIEIVFFQEAMRCMGIQEILYLNKKFVDMFIEQIEFNGFFKPQTPKSGTFINLQNGTLQINSNGVTLQPHNPNDFMQHLLDYSYDPNSRNLQWESFLSTVLPDIDTQKTLQQAIAYTFTKGLKLEKAIFLYGTGSNGKSVIFEVYKNIIDPSMMTNYSLESLLDSKGYHRYNIQNKNVNYGTDVAFKFLNHGIFKQLVSGEPVEARLPGRDPIIIDDYAKLIFNINTLDSANIEETIGFLRRMLFIPFEITIEDHQKDKNLPLKILQNKSGILNWIIEGIQQVLQNQDIFISNECKHFFVKFQKGSSITSRFFEECLTTSFNSEIKFQEMYETFRKYCKKQGEKPKEQRKFNTELRKFLTDKRKKHGYIWEASFNSTNLNAMSITV